MGVWVFRQAKVLAASGKRQARAVDMLMAQRGEFAKAMCRLIRACPDRQKAELTSLPKIGLCGRSHAD